MKTAFRSALMILVILFTFCACSAAPDGTVSAETKKKEATIKAGDGTVVYYGEIDYPAVEIKGNKEAASLINEGINGIVNQVIKPDFDYKAEYENYISQGLDYMSSASHTCSVIRANSSGEYISFEILTYTHEACAMRDLEAVSGITFSASTGEETDIYGLSVDDSAMKALIEESIISGNKDISDFDENAARELIEEKDFGWYITDDSLVVTLEAGQAAPVAEGYIQAEIPLTSIT